MCGGGAWRGTLTQNVDASRAGLEKWDETNEEKGRRHAPEDLTDHVKEFAADTEKAKSGQRDEFGNHSNSPGNAAERPDLSLNNRYLSSNSYVH